MFLEHYILNARKSHNIITAASLHGATLLSAAFSVSAASHTMLLKEVNYYARRLCRPPRKR